jgi:hypothetical protein
MVERIRSLLAQFPEDEGAVRALVARDTCRSRKSRPEGFTQCGRISASSHGNIELMPKKQVLDFKPAPRLKGIDGRTYSV